MNKTQPPHSTSFNLPSTIAIYNLVKVFDNHQTQVLKNLNLTVKSAEMLAIIGKSGSGKSTLLHIMGGLDHPTSGTVIIGEDNLNSLNEADRAQLRNRHLGFIYQFHHLLPEFSALENVMMPLLIRKTNTKLASNLAREIIAAVGLNDRQNAKIGELSGGEKQRIAIARALVTKPAYVLADEPTGNLDQKTALQIYELIVKLNQELGTSFIIATHDLSIAKLMPRCLILEDGQLITNN